METTAINVLIADMSDAKMQRETTADFQLRMRVSGPAWRVDLEFGGHDFISGDRHNLTFIRFNVLSITKGPDVSDPSRQVLAEICPLARLHSRRIDEHF